MTFNRSDLTSRLQRRLETERAEIETTAARELKVLGESLRGVAENALRTIEADTAAATGRMRALLLRAWVRPLVIGLSLSVGICGGSWAAMRLGVRPVPERQARAGEDSAHARGPDRPAHLRHRLRPSRLQRCRAPRRRPHPQAAARPRPGGGRVTGLAADAVAVRERSRPRRALRHGVRVGGACCRAPPPPAGAGSAHHDRSGPDRRPDARRPAVQPLYHTEAFVSLRLYLDRALGA